MTTEAIARQLAEQVKSLIAKRDDELAEMRKRLDYLESIPEPKDGKDGAPGEKGEKGDPGEAIIKNLDQLDEIWEKLMEVYSRPAPRDGRDGIQGVKGDPGERGYDGHDGADGWSPDHVEMTIDDEGQWEFKMVTGDKVKSFTGRIPVNVDRGVFSNENSYSKGHMVTYGGDVWVCKEDNPGPPGKDFAGWRLAVRKGRDAPRAKV